MRVKTSKVTERKYYKYDDTNLVNVAIADNAIVGAEYAEATGSIANAFNGSAVVGVWCECWVDRNTSISGIAYIGQQNLTQKIKKINFWQGGYGSGSYNLCVSSVKIQISEDGTNWTDVQTVAVNNGTASSTTCYFTEITVNDYVVPSTPYQMRLLANSGVIHGNNGGWFINEVEFYADSIIEGTSSDYDFYKDIDTYKAIYDTERKYYKYVPYTKYAIPSLSANTTEYGTCSKSGAVGGQAYQFTNAVLGGTYGGDSITFAMSLASDKYIPAGTIAEFSITSGNTKVGFYPGCINGCKITYTYTDNTTEIVFNNSNFIPYSGNGVPSTATATCSIANKDVKAITFNEYHSYNTIFRGGIFNLWYEGADIEEGTPEDYDFYKDITVYKGVTNGN